jgi:hypothetical protein
MVLCSCKFWIQILEMFNKSLPHIIFNKWTFFDLMSNLMTICALWKVRSWNFVHIMNSSTLIPWNFSNNVSTLVVKFGFTIPYSNNHMYTFCYFWFYFSLNYSFLSSYKYWFNSFETSDALSCTFLLDHIMNWRFKILSYLFKFFIFMFLLMVRI